MNDLTKLSDEELLSQFRDSCNAETYLSYRAELLRRLAAHRDELVPPLRFRLAPGMKLLWLMDGLRESPAFGQDTWQKFCDERKLRAEFVKEEPHE